MSIENTLSPEGKSLFSSRLIQRKFPANQTILHKGDPVSGAYFVLSGTLRVYSVSENGKEATLYTISPGETCILAVNSLFNDFLYPAWVVTGENTTIGILPGQTYRTLFKTEETIQDITIKALSATVFGLMTQLEQQKVQTVRQRLAGYLLNRATSQFIIQATQQQIADDLGSSREFVARILSEFNDKGFIRSGRGKILLLDCPALNGVCQDGE